MSDVISIIAIIISIGSFVYTIYSNARAVKNAAMFNNLTTIINVEAQLANVPSALKFHGVSIKELENINITPQEFAYLLTSFTAGGIYYKTYFPNDSTPFDKNSYRYEMCQSEQTRNAWPILKKFITNTNYRKKIENTIDLINKEEINP